MRLLLFQLLQFHQSQQFINIFLADFRLQVVHPQQEVFVNRMIHIEVKILVHELNFRVTGDQAVFRPGNVLAVEDNFTGIGIQLGRDNF